MSTANEVEVSGGTRCFGANVTITADAAGALVARVFVVIEPAIDAGRDSHKAIVFDDHVAISVLCITAEDVRRLQQWSTAGQARMVVAGASTVTPEVAQIITCPPPDSLGPEAAVSDRLTDPRLDVSEKLDRLTEWARGSFWGSLAA
jgi:hypothetical protein